MGRVRELGEPPAAPVAPRVGGGGAAVVAHRDHQGPQAGRAEAAGDGVQVRDETRRPHAQRSRVARARKVK